MVRIAILDDNITHLQMAELALTGEPDNWDEPIEVFTFTSGLNLLNRLKTDVFDCVVLDRNVPDMAGDVVLQWLRQYRGTATPVVMLTSKKDSQELVELLKAGADEYLTKPFYPAELLLRVQRLIKKNRKVFEDSAEVDSAAAIFLPKTNKRQIYEINGVVFDDFNLTVDHAEQLVKLTELEYNLAKLFFSNVGVNLSREFILQKIWHRDKETTHSLTTHVHRIRDKLELTAENGWTLRPVYGYGYRLDYFREE